MFTLTLSNTSANGLYDFVLDKPIDELPGTVGVLNFTFDYSARDFDGDTGAGSFTVTVNDDAPLIAGAASGSVDEAGLTATTDPYGAGNHAGSASFPTAASGTLPIHFGADGSAAATPVTDIFNLTLQNETFKLAVGGVARRWQFPHHGRCFR